MDAVSFTTHLTARDVMRVAAVLFMRNGIAVLAMAAGPVFWLMGVTGGSSEVTRLGLTLMPLVVGVPAFALLLGSYGAYRPGSSELYEPVAWTFSDEAVDVAHPGRHARAEWDEFRTWRVSGGCYVLYTGGRSHYLLLPVRDLTGDGRSAFEDLLEAHLGPKRR